MINSDLNNQTMKHLLKKFSSSELFVLPEAASYLKVSEKYLASLIKQGKLKAFKVDEHWFVEEKWLIDYKKNIRTKLETEKKDHAVLKTKARPWLMKINRPEEKESSFRWFSPLAWLAQSVVLSAFVTCVAILIMPLGQINNQKQELASAFLTGVDNVYSWPLDTVAARPAQGAVNDEVLTRQANEIWNKYQRRGRVAGASEQRTVTPETKPLRWPK